MTARILQAGQSCGTFPQVRGEVCRISWVIPSESMLTLKNSECIDVFALCPIGDLCDDQGESSEGSISSPQLRQRPAVARRLSSRLRSRMCRSMGADLDNLLQEEAAGGGGIENTETARLRRLHRISSSLSLRYNLSSSSLSSCSTPPRYHSFGDLVEIVDGRGEGKNIQTATEPTVHNESRSRQVRLKGGSLL